MIDYTYIIITITVFVGYYFKEQKSYRASWRVHLFAIIGPCFLLTLKNINIYAKYFLFTILIWHIVDVATLIYNNDMKTILEAYSLQHSLK
jgi:hypothetical protein